MDITKIDTEDKDIIVILKEIEEKINEIIDWINSQGE
tara:strand:- start:376 stop:486 length:111 start_codon:yes stop_codon:yes gene_type:complete